MSYRHLDMVSDSGTPVRSTLAVVVELLYVKLIERHGVDNQCLGSSLVCCLDKQLAGGRTSQRFQGKTAGTCTRSMVRRARNKNRTIEALTDLLADESLSNPFRGETRD